MFIVYEFRLLLCQKVIRPAQPYQNIFIGAIYVQQAKTPDDVLLAQIEFVFLTETRLINAKLCLRKIYYNRARPSSAV